MQQVEQSARLSMKKITSTLARDEMELFARVAQRYFRLPDEEPPRTWPVGPEPPNFSNASSLAGALGFLKRCGRTRLFLFGSIDRPTFSRRSHTRTKCSEGTDLKIPEFHRPIAKIFDRI